MNPNAVGSEEWEECPKGTLQSFANRSRRQRTMKRAAWATPLTLVLLVWAGLLPSPFSPKSSALACDQVVELLPEYASNSLSANRRAQVEQHLKKCPFCAEKLRTIRSTQSVVENSVIDRDCTPVKRFSALRTTPNRLGQSRNIGQDHRLSLSTNQAIRFQLAHQNSHGFSRGSDEVCDFLMRKFEAKPNTTFDGYAKLLC